MQCIFSHPPSNDVLELVQEVLEQLPPLLAGMTAVDSLNGKTITQAVSESNKAAQQIQAIVRGRQTRRSSSVKSIATESWRKQRRSWCYRRMRRGEV